MTAQVIRRNRAVVCLSLLMLLATTWTVVSVNGPAGAAASSGSGSANTYRISGSLNGTLRDGPLAGCPYGGINSNGFIDLNDLVGSVSGIKGVGSWSLDANVKKNGTYSFKAIPIGDPNAELNVNLKNGNIAQGVRDNFFARSGKITVKGETGSISAAFSQTQGKTIKLVAKWACGPNSVAAKLSGPGWSTPVKVDQASQGVNLTSISCPTTAFCAAIDGKGNALTLHGTTWSAPVGVDSGPQSDINNTFASVSCASPTFCVAGDDLDDVYTYNGTSWSAVHQLNPSVTSASVSFSVACPTATFCMAVDGNNNFFTFSGSAWSAPQVIDASTLNSLVIGEISCVSATFCVAAYGRNTVTYNGTAWSPPVTIGTAPGTTTGESANLEGISCASTTFCAGVGTTSSNTAYLDTFNGSTWSPAVIRKTNLGPQAFLAVSCPTTTFCMAPGLDGWVTYSSSGWSTPQTFADPGGPIGAGPEYATSVSCPSVSSCQEVESLGYTDHWTG